MPTFSLALLLCLAPGAAPPPRPLWVAVVAPEFADALRPLALARREQGFRVRIVRTTDVLTERQLLRGDVGPLRDRVRKLCRDHAGESYVLLVGAVESLFAGRILPPCLGSLGRMKGKPTDAPYGCPDGGTSPSIAVGRFPARDADEVALMVAKTLAFERAGLRPGEWKRRLTVLAGIPAYNPLVDRLVEMLALSRFDRVHPAWVGRAVYTNPLSRFYLPAGAMKPRALDYLAEGQAFSLYLGHSNAQGLYGGQGVEFLDRRDWGEAKMPHGGGVFVTYGCFGCQLAGPDGEGYGVWAMRNATGPAAVVGSHGECFAAMVNLAADGLFARAFAGPELPGRLGAVWLASLDGVARGRIDWLSYKALDAVDGDSRIPQPTQRLEHLEMFVLLGDPASRLPSPAPLRASVPRTATAGAELEVSGALPAGMESAKVTVRLVRLPASVPAGLVAVPRQGEGRDRALRDNHEKANDFTLAAEQVRASDGAFAVALSVPRELAGTYAVRIYAATKDRDAAFARRVEVRKGP